MILISKGQKCQKYMYEELKEDSKFSNFSNQQPQSNKNTNTNYSNDDDNNNNYNCNNDINYHCSVLQKDQEGLS